MERGQSQVEKVIALISARTSPEEVNNTQPSLFIMVA